jgi:hypothetical protein
MPTLSNYYDDTLSLQDATDYLRNLLSEFPFGDWGPEQSDGTRNSRSQAVHISAMLGQFAGRLVPREVLRPGYIYDSNSQGSGKSLLCKTAIMPANGFAASQAWNPKDEELRKVLDAEVLRAARYVFFDNVRAHVSSQVLEGFMTTTMWTGRRLGKTEMFQAANTATVFITGNDLSVSSDIKRRTLQVTLFVAEADVQTRQVQHPIDDFWLLDAKNRREILNALWAIVRHWADAGKPLATQNLRVGYERWCQVFGGLVQFAGFGDPFAPVADEEEDMDTEAVDMRLLIKLMAEPLLKGEEQRVEYPYQTAVNMAHENGLFDWILDGKETETVEGEFVKKDFILKADAHSKFGKLMKRYAPAANEAKGPKYRVFRFARPQVADDVPVSTLVIQTSCLGRANRRRYILEIPKDLA